jgi:quinol monooxygenase YgiN/catechol 2,3-dioxygenase-like lactoylglutathione lyase family enzyme
VITVTAVQKVRPGKEAALDRLMAKLTGQVLGAEQGCVAFEYVTPLDGDGRTRTVIEKYRDDEALRRHQSTPYLRDFIPELMECLLEAPAVQVYRDLVAPPPPTAFFHTGIVVPDLEKAVARYSAVLGIQFTEPAVFDVPRLEDPEPHEFKLTAVMSMTEPPYYELIQAEGDGIVSAAQCGGILYYGLYESDIAGRLEQLRAQDVAIDALFRMDGDRPPFAMITGPDLLGGRIEYVDISDREPLTEWVRTGKFPGGIGG